MKSPIAAAVLNFFLMGAGTLYLGKRKVLGIALTIAAGALTYVELSIQTQAPALYPIMFGAVFLANTVLAIDGWREAKEINASKEPSGVIAGRRVLAR